MGTGETSCLKSKKLLFDLSSHKNIHDLCFYIYSAVNLSLLPFIFFNVIVLLVFLYRLRHCKVYFKADDHGDNWLLFCEVQFSLFLKQLSLSLFFRVTRSERKMWISTTIPAVSCSHQQRELQWGARCIFPSSL